MTASITPLKGHRFTGGGVLCALCNVGRSGFVHRRHPEPHAPVSVRVQAIVDLKHAPIGTRYLINGEPYEVVGVEL